MNFVLAEIILALITSVEGSPEEKQLLDSLVKMTSQLPIYKPTHNPDFSEALNLTLMAICGCDRHSSLNTKSLRQWFNKLQQKSKKLSLKTIEKKYIAYINCILKYKLVDVYYTRKSKTCSLDENLQYSPEITLDGLDKLIIIEDEEEVNAITQYLQNDPDQKLMKCHLKEYPHCTAWVLVQRRLLQPKAEKWQTLAKELQIPYGTLTAFWHRKCLTLLQEIGNQFNL